MSMTREEAIAILQEKYDFCKSFYDLAAHPEEDYPEMEKYLQALQIALSALRPVSREQLDVVINSLKLRLENNEENGVVYLPKFAVEQMIERLEVLRDD